jgi:hypothetical protein
MLQAYTDMLAHAEAGVRPSPSPGAAARTRPRGHPGGVDNALRVPLDHTGASPGSPLRRVDVDPALQPGSAATVGAQVHASQPCAELLRH